MDVGDIIRLKQPLIVPTLNESFQFGIVRGIVLDETDVDSGVPSDCKPIEIVIALYDPDLGTPIEDEFGQPFLYSIVADEIELD